MSNFKVKCMEIVCFDRVENKAYIFKEKKRLAAFLGISVYVLKNKMKTMPFKHDVFLVMFGEELPTKK